MINQHSSALWCCSLRALPGQAAAHPAAVWAVCLAVDHHLVVCNGLLDGFSLQQPQPRVTLSTLLPMHRTGRLLNLPWALTAHLVTGAACQGPPLHSCEEINVILVSTVS